jgi:SMC interacting uncharacterized protein involved in chromosome segregation
MAKEKQIEKLEAQRKDLWKQILNHPEPKSHEFQEMKAKYQQLQQQIRAIKMGL